jgi:hypothetical protein
LVLLGFLPHYDVLPEPISPHPVILVDEFHELAINTSGEDQRPQSGQVQCSDLDYTFSVLITNTILSFEAALGLMSSEPALGWMLLSFKVYFGLKLMTCLYFILQLFYLSHKTQRKLVKLSIGDHHATEQELFFSPERRLERPSTWHCCFCGHTLQNTSVPKNKKGKKRKGPPQKWDLNPQKWEYNAFEFLDGKPTQHVKCVGLMLCKGFVPQCYWPKIFDKARS